LDVQTEGKALLEAAANLAGQMIAAQSQLEGLRQIYTDSNPRVRQLEARVNELRKQLDKMGGAKTEVTGGGPAATEMPYPSIRNLPLLGVKYADYYRDAKIEETVFELLTEQDEMAKVQEAKETPSVRVLDPAKIPEKKSYPPRFFIVFLGLCTSFTMGMTWILAERIWKNADPQDPRKILVEEVVATVKAQSPWASRNGNHRGSMAQLVWKRFSRRV
jgi:capsule polysaccharide export protein KpsE/RkpR